MLKHNLQRQQSIQGATDGIARKTDEGPIRFSLPVDAPLYQPQPITYSGVRMLLFDYLTDAAVWLRLARIIQVGWDKVA